ncbi:hypothetical protein [Aureimonas sp. AU12]|uniref:hypothetical protein n=1 Tax=Aureimonas sp. AU12 TaxID=1638161 RepID=UPI0009E66E8F|nr:hypothetical protein [Aureimonas sp. AU12]
MPVQPSLLRGTIGRVEVPPHLHNSLKRLAAGTHHRGPRGWTPPEGPMVPAEHVTQLAMRNLCKVRAGRRRALDRADLTDLGREVADAVADMCRANRAAS